MKIFKNNKYFEILKFKFKFKFVLNTLSRNSRFLLEVQIFHTYNNLPFDP